MPDREQLEQSLLRLLHSSQIITPRQRWGTPGDVMIFFDGKRTAIRDLSDEDLFCRVHALQKQKRRMARGTEWEEETTMPAPKGNPRRWDQFKKLGRNPETGSSYPDFFEGRSRVFKPLEELSEEQIKKLPRKAFSEDEWEELDEDIQEYIYNHDLESIERRTAFAKILEESVQHIVELDLDYAMSWAESGIEYFLSDTDTLLNIAKNIGEYKDLKEEFSHIDEDSFNEALQELLSDFNMYEWDIEIHDPYSRRRGLEIVEPVFDSVYIEWKSWGIHGSPDEITEDEVAFVVDYELESSEARDIFDGHADEIWNSIHSKYGTLELYFDHQAAVVGSFKWEDASEALLEELGEAPEEIPFTPLEERVVYRYPDGAYVLDLHPDELPEEGKKMRMCVGKQNMGYIDAVKRGQRKIFSLRTESGRPKFTIEVKVGSDGGLDEIVQIKGKANRLPGWDLRKVGQGNVKKDEVEKIVTFVENLGFDPEDIRDLRPGYRAIQGLTPNPVEEKGHCGFCCPVGKQRGK